MDALILTKAILLIALVSICSATDLAARRIPNIVLLPVLVAALVIHSYSGGLAGTANAVGGFLIGSAFLLPLYVKGGTSAGDVKLLGVVGATLGIAGSVVAGLATLIAGSIFALSFIVWQAMSSTLYLLMSKFARTWTGSNVAVHIAPPPRSLGNGFPYAPAIAAGAYAAMWYLDFFSPVR